MENGRGKKEGKEGGKAPQPLGTAVCCLFRAREHKPPGTQCSADRRLPDSGETPHSALTLPGHTQGQHYTGYTWDDGGQEGRERRGEKERESARALVLEKGEKKEPY